MQLTNQSNLSQYPLISYTLWVKDTEQLLEPWKYSALFRYGLKLLSLVSLIMKSILLIIRSSNPMRISSFVGHVSTSPLRSLIEADRWRKSLYTPFVYSLFHYYLSETQKPLQCFHIFFLLIFLFQLPPNSFYNENWPS